MEFKERIAGVQFKQSHQDRQEEVKADSFKQKKADSSPSTPIDDVLSQFKSQRQEKTQAQDQPSDDLFSQLRHKHESQKEKPSDYSPRQYVDEIRKAEYRKQRQEKQLIAQAQKWLKELQPYSDEGVWFAQFAESYPSRLEAAIDYLKALQ